MTTDVVPFGHLLALTDRLGVFEHAEWDEPRRTLGYCVDDVARALIVVARQAEPFEGQQRLHETYLGFIESAITRDGLCHNRMSARGVWTDEPAMGDWWGRALWALGVVAGHGASPFSRMRALRAFGTASARTSPDLRTVAFATLGAGEVLSLHAEHQGARRIIDELVWLAMPAGDFMWPWPEPRLAYANAVIPEALMVAAAVRGDDALLDRGLDMLRFLITTETTGEIFSVTGAGGRGPGEHGPMFDQQPLEIAAIADACARAYALTDDPAWLSHLARAWAWFEGENDAGTTMFDPETGAGFDGLERAGRNQNRGAESTLAALSTLQWVHRYGLVAAP